MAMGTPNLERSNADPTPTDPTRTFLGVLIALTFVMNTIGRGVAETFAVFLLPVEAGLSLTRAEISATYSVYMLAYAFSAPFVGQLIDRFGARATYTFGLLSLGLGYLVGGSATGLWTYYASVGVFGGIGAAALGMVTASGLLSRWFTSRMGTVSSLPYAAIGAGMLLFPPVTQVLISSYGWRASHRMLGVFVLVFLPLLFVLPLGRFTAGSNSWQALRATAAQTAGGPWTLRAAITTGAFRGLFAAYFATSVAAYAVLPHSVAFLIERGFDPLAAAGAFGFTGLLSVIGIISMGTLSDRFGRLHAVTLSYVSSMLGVICLLGVVAIPSLILVYGFVLFFGLMQGARGPILVALVAKIFAGGSVGTIFGALSMALGLGAAAGSLASGLLHQATGGYAASFALAIMASGAGMATFWFVPSLRQERVIPLNR
jgi:MFS family permease